MAGELGFKEVVAMGVGGIIGGGIFAVLGVAASLSGNAAFVTYFVAGMIAFASGYSYVKLTGHLHEDGGSFTFLEHYTENKNIAGVVAWVLIVGYIGTMAMYAYAFGSFAAGIFGIDPSSVLRGLISVGIIGVFIGLNMFSVRETGRSEDLLVYAKVLILLMFSGAGLYAMFTRPELQFFTGGIFNHGLNSAIISIGAVFVSFEGWQLLTYEYSDIQGGIETLKKGVFASIAISVLIYVVVALVTTSLVSPAMILAHKETVLAFAAGKIFSNPIAVKMAVGLVSLAALFSTASAINATLFGTARFTHKIAVEKELPELFSFQNKKGIPTKSLLVIGVLTAIFTFIGSLEEITTFASVSFIAIFGVVNFVCLTDSDLEKNAWIPWFGLVGSMSALGLLIWHLYTRQTHVLVFLVTLYLVLFTAEILYFERGLIEKEAEELEEEIEGL